MIKLVSDFEIKLFSYLDKKLKNKDLFSVSNENYFGMILFVRKYLRYFGILYPNSDDYYGIKYLCYNIIAKNRNKNLIDLDFKDLIGQKFKIRNRELQNAFILNFLEYDCVDASTISRWINQSDTGLKYVCYEKRFSDAVPFFAYVNNEKYKLKYNTVNTFGRNIKLPKGITDETRHVTLFELETVINSKIDKDNSFKKAIYDQLAVDFTKGFKLGDDQQNRYYISAPPDEDTDTDIYFKFTSIRNENEKIIFDIKIINIIDAENNSKINPNDLSRDEKIAIKNRIHDKVYFLIQFDKHGYDLNTSVFSANSIDLSDINIKF